MEVIDKTRLRNWDYGTILKCWVDNPEEYDLYQIARAHSVNDNYELDVLHYHDKSSESFWYTSFPTLDDLLEDIKVCYQYVVPVKAAVIIEHIS